MNISAGSPQYYDSKAIYNILTRAPGTTTTTTRETDYMGMHI
jgi:hypothetical protein